MELTSVQLSEIGKEAKRTSKRLAQASPDQKNKVLDLLSTLLQENKGEILAANEIDLNEGAMSDLASEMLDRLSLQGDRIEGIRSDLLKVKELPDPIGEIFEKATLPNGLRIEKWRTPLGVLGVIYESRPNVTIDVASLAIKSGNAAILRGGSETLNTNRVLIKIIQEALRKGGLPENCIQFIDSPDRNLVNHLLRMHESIDLIIPRGGAGLHRFCRENSTIPVITGGIGICHLFVDKECDEKRSIDIIYNAKTQRPTVCNALDTLLVHQDIAQTFIPKVVEALKQGNVRIRADAKTIEWLGADSGIVKADDNTDWDTEWLDLILGIKIVSDVEEAIEHIQNHSSGHSDGILSDNKESIKKFVAAIDSAAVYINASTRFTDGAQFGLGSEVAVSTQKLHARGPMGLRELTSYKWVIEGDYNVRK